MNLYSELVNELKDHNKTIEDIRWISVKSMRFDIEPYSFCIEIENFLEIAKRTNYDDGYGGAEIPTSLIIAGDDWWLERGEYDGSEWFEFKTYPTKPERTETIEKIRNFDD